MKSFLRILFLQFLPATLFLPFQNFAQITLVEWNFPNNPDDTMADGGIAANLSKTIITDGNTGPVVFIHNGVTTRSARADGWNNGSGLKCWEIEFSTQGYYDLDLISRQMSSGTGPKDFRIQYKVGASGIYNDLFLPVTISNTTGWFGPASPVALPSACDDQPSVYVRWIMTSDDAVGGGYVTSGGASRIDDIIIRAKATNDYYRSVANGNWDNTAVWESSPDNVNWFPAELRPSYYAKTITVRNPHTITSSSSVTIDETIIESGATLDYFSGTITLNNGPGIDLVIDGTFLDQGASVIWAAGATWQAGANATYVKTAGGSATVWRDNYHGGISNIPATADWIIRKNSAANPTLVTVGGMYYPNLTIENYTAGIWVTGPTSSFTGNSNFPVIKGNFDVGGTGSGTIDFANDNTNASPVQIWGNLIVRAGSFARNNGSGYEIRGNLIVDGTITYGSSNSRQFLFSGGNNQSITGSGTINVYNLAINKSFNDLSLFNPVTIDNTLSLLNGRIFTNSANLLTINSSATVTGTNNSSFVHGPVAKKGSAGFIFPVGKNNDYQPIEIGAGTDADDIFIGEYYYADPQIVYGNSLSIGLDHISQCEHWSLDRIAGTSSRTVRLSWDLNSCGVTFLPDLRVARFDGLIWQDEGNGGTTGTNTSGTIISSGTLASFGPFTLSSASTQNPLPVELVHFNAYIDGDYVNTEWITASEKNNDYFEIQKSSNGLDFVSVGFLAGAGNSQNMLSYQFVDTKPFAGTSYYRLRQVDFDGSETISPPVSVRFNSSPIVKMFPNPAQDFLTIASSGTTFLKIVSTSGQVLYNTEIQSRHFIDLSSFAPGFYFCEISDGNSPLFVEKLLIDR